MQAYQRSVKEARDTYFSNLIAGNYDKPRVLFQAINSVVGLLPTQPMEDIRLHISPEKNKS